MEKQIQKEDEISLKEIILSMQDWWKYLLSKWVVILIAAIVGGVSGFVYMYCKNPLYKAELTFVLENERSGGAGGLSGLASQFGIDVGSGGGGVFEGENLLSLMKSRAMIQKTLLTPVNVKGKVLTLAEFYIHTYNLRGDSGKRVLNKKRISFPPGDTPEKFSVKQNDLMGTLYGNIISKNLVVDRKDKKTSIIAVDVNSENELFSKYFAESLVANVSDFYVETKTKKSAENLAVIQYRVDSVKAALNSAMTGFAASIDQTPNPNTERQSLMTLSRKKQYDIQINQAILTQLVQNMEIAKMTLSRETPLINVIDRPVLSLPKENPNKIKGFISGIVIGGIMAISLLICRRTLKRIMA